MSLQRDGWRRGAESLGFGQFEEAKGAVPSSPHPHDDPTPPPGHAVTTPTQESAGHKLLFLVSNMCITLYVIWPVQAVPEFSIHFYFYQSSH